MEFSPHKILCLLDLSPASGEVLKATRLFAEKFGCTVEVLHATWPPAPHQVTEEQGQQLLEEFGLRTDELQRTVRSTAEEVLGSSVDYEVVIGIGHPVKVVVDRIGKLKPDLIVLGAHGHDGMARSLMGSVAENVVRESAYPTLVVKGRDPQASQGRLKRLLCPVDLTRSGIETVDVAASLAAKFGAELDILRVLPDTIRDMDAPEGQLREWVAEVVRKRCPVAEVVRTGDVGEQIIMFARQREVDLIVVGAEYRRFLEFTVLGRTTERVVRHGPCSVLLLRLQASEN